MSQLTSGSSRPYHSYLLWNPRSSRLPTQPPVCSLLRHLKSKHTALSLPWMVPFWKDTVDWSSSSRCLGTSRKLWATAWERLACAADGAPRPVSASAQLLQPGLCAAQLTSWEGPLLKPGFAKLSGSLGKDAALGFRERAAPVRQVAKQGVARHLLTLLQR